MDKKLYPLDVGQMLQYLPIRETGTQRCCNISIFSGLQTEIDFDLLKRCIQDEFRRYECLRLRFTAPDENGFVQQYIADRDDRDVPFIDLSNLTMKEADAFLQEKTYEEFNAPEIPMVEITMVRMPEGYNGMYIHIDHRLVDSSGLIVMVNDIMELYCHYRFGSEYPKPLASFEEVLISDLKKAKNEKRRAKDEKFWHDYLTENGEPIYSDIKGSRILQESRKKHGNKSLRAADVETVDRSVGVADFHLEPEATQKLMDFCMMHGVSMTNLRTCGGSRVLSFPLRTIISPDTEFLDALYEIQNVQNKIYLHCNYDPVAVDKMLKELYGAPDNTEYISMSLTYQPMPVRMQNEHLAGINTRSVWYPNGAATKRIYLTVTHSSNDGGLIFDYHYQKAVLSYDDIQRLYYYMMKMMFRGVDEPDVTIGELISTV